MGRAFWFCLILSVTVGSSEAQEALAGKGKFPQARTVSGLSGGALGIRPDGTPGAGGALSMSTPIGYTLAGNRLAMVGSNTSASRSLRWFDGKTTVNRSNGNAAVIMGIPISTASLAVSLMQTSRLSEDRVINLQFSPGKPKSRVGMSFGIQDAFDETVTTPDYHENSRSLFAAATYDAGNGVYVTAGVGTVRFGQGFASSSVPLGKNGRAMLEHDGFGWNYGASYNLGTLGFFGAEPTRATMFLGICQGRYLTWSLSLSR